MDGVLLSFSSSWLLFLVDTASYTRRLFPIRLQLEKKYLKNSMTSGVKGVTDSNLKKTFLFL